MDTIPLLVLDLAVKAAVVVLSLYPVVRPGSSHFDGKALRFRAAVYPVFTLLIPAAWLVAGQPGPYPFLADIALGFPFAFDAAGNDFDWFAIKGFDVWPHLLGWCSLSVSFGLALSPMLGERWIALLVVIGFGATIAILWEIGEFLLMKSGSSGLDLTYENTIQDLAMSWLGGVAGAILTVTLLWPAAGTPATLFGWS